MVTNLLSLLKDLPSEIIRYIIPYTYNLQSSLLLSDIRNFTETKQKISDIYYKSNEHLIPYEKDADKYWLVSDICLFIRPNKYKKPTKQKSIHTQFNMYWAFLSEKERNHFIQIRSKKNK
jgi:hypothetical protein